MFRVRRGRAVGLVAMALTACLSLVSATAVCAQTSGAREQALAIFSRANERYREGDYEAAAVLLREAIALVPQEPTLHYNLGRALDELDQREDAIRAYRRFLELAPTEAQRQEVEARIVVLEDMSSTAGSAAPEVVTQAAVRAAPSAPPARAVAPEPWVVAGSSVAPAIVGVVGAVLFQGAVEGARTAESQMAAAPLVDEANTYAILADVSFALAGALAVAGLIWGVIDVTTEPEASVSLTLGPTGVVLRGRL